MARYQVRGPHGPIRTYARWTLVDTADRNVTVCTSRTKADALAAARELNADSQIDEYNTSVVS